MNICGHCAHYANVGGLHGIICMKTGKPAGYLQTKTCFEAKNTKTHETMTQENNTKQEETCTSRRGRQKEHPNYVDKETGLTMKWCTGCHQYKPIDEFHANSTHLDGHSFDCKECHNAMSNKYNRRRAAEKKAAMGAAQEQPGEPAAAAPVQEAPAAKPSLSHFTDRELADELHARGWSGTLSKNLSVA